MRDTALSMVMSDNDGARQHVSADVAPELYEPEDER
jgi:hypothetical protein